METGILRQIGLIIGAYLLGSVSSAYYVTKWKNGADIRQLGSGNAGARNVMLMVGASFGVVVAIFDVLKGVVPIIFAKALKMPPHTITLTALAAISGHNWPIFLQFRGGSGLATLTGVILPLMPREAILLSLVGIAVARTCLYFPAWYRRAPAIESSCLVIYVICPFLAWHFGEPVYLVSLPLYLGVPVIIRRISLLKNGLYERLARIH
ncbi:MAG: glycerol-3-phosphate acyltransferase [bacterium]